MGTGGSRERIGPAMGITDVRARPERRTQRLIVGRGDLHDEELDRAPARLRSVLEDRQVATTVRSELQVSPRLGDRAPP